MQDETLFLALETIKKNKQALVFAPSRASAEKTAEEIAEKTAIFLPEISRQILRAVATPTKQCRRLSNCVKKGIAFHHAGLTQKQRGLIENEFRKGSIKIICCTPTLAAGISTPAFRVIIKSLKRYSGKWGMDWIPVLEYHQMAGRAGRPEFEPYGEALTIAKDEREKSEIYEHYVKGKPEEIYSKLAVEPVFRTYLLALIATRIVNSEKAVVDFFSKTFWAFQFKDMNKLKQIINKMLGLLEQYGFVEISDEEKKSSFVKASSLEKKEKAEIKATEIGQRVSQLYLDPFTANHFVDCLKKNYQKKDELEITSFSFLQMTANTLEMSPLLRVKTKEADWMQEELAKKYGQLLETEPEVYDLNYEDYMNSIKTALFFEAWIDEQDEDFLLEKYDIKPGEIYAKLEIADWLLYSAAELAKLLGLQSLLKEISKLRVRVKYGAKEELLPLLRLKGIGRKRARKLYNNRIKDLGDLKKSSLGILSELVGEKTAVLIKEQLENPEKPIPGSKRSGQLSLPRFE